jgi:hypothetical protein
MNAFVLFLVLLSALIPYLNRLIPLLLLFLFRISIAVPNVAVTNNVNFKKADALMGDFEDWIVEHEENPTTQNEVSDELLEDMWKIMVDFPHVGPRQWEELSVLPKEWSRDRLKELKHVKKQQEQFKDAQLGGESAKITCVRTFLRFRMPEEGPLQLETYPREPSLDIPP